jgi:MFS family permease
VAGKLAGLTGIRVALVSAGLVQAAATMLLFTLPHSKTLLVIVAGTIVLNFSDVVAIVMINIGATSGLPDESQGLAGGLVTATQQVGAAIGLAAIAAVVSAQTASAAHSLIATPAVADLLHGYRWGLGVAAAVSLAGALLALAALRSPSPAQTGAAQTDAARTGAVQAGATQAGAAQPDVPVHQ